MHACNPGARAALLHKAYPGGRIVDSIARKSCYVAEKVLNDACVVRFEACCDVFVHVHIVSHYALAPVRVY